MKIVDFIEARLMEDERDVADAWSVIRQAEGMTREARDAWLRKIAARYSDHPEYDPDWDQPDTSM